MFDPIETQEWQDAVIKTSNTGVRRLFLPLLIAYIMFFMVVGAYHPYFGVLFAILGVALFYFWLDSMATHDGNDQSNRSMLYSGVRRYINVNTEIDDLKSKGKHISKELEEEAILHVYNRQEIECYQYDVYGNKIINSSEYTIGRTLFGDDDLFDKLFELGKYKFLNKSCIEEKFAIIIHTDSTIVNDMFYGAKISELEKGKWVDSEFPFKIKLFHNYMLGNNFYEMKFIIVPPCFFDNEDNADDNGLCFGVKDNIDARYYEENVYPQSPPNTPTTWM